MSIQVNEKGTLKTTATHSNVFVDLIGVNSAEFVNSNNSVPTTGKYIYTCPFTPSIVIFISHHCKVSSSYTYLPVCRIPQGQSANTGSGHFCARTI